MLLKRLEIYGFKSFADRIYMNFDKGITAIVGPNGSGKSNIADAVRWVLGEQSVKSLRGSKMEDVIFSGTQIRKSIGFAEVSLTLDNTEGLLPVEYSEVMITRRVFRSGDSEYFINRNTCRLKDIIELFMDTGVGKEGYSIIGQGRIDVILSNRPEDRRYIFEEAAGIVKYKSRRDESERKLTKTQENLLRAEDILSELAQQLCPLEEQARIAREYLVKKEQLKMYEMNYFLHQYSQLNVRINELKQQINHLDREILDLKKQEKETEAKKDFISQSLSDMQKELSFAQEQRYSLLNDLEKKKGEQNVLLERIHQFEKDNVRLMEEFKKKISDIERIQSEGKSIERLIHEKNLAYEQTSKKSEMIQARLKELNIEIQNFQKHINETKNDMFQLLNRISDCRNQLIRYNTMENNLRNRWELIEKHKGEIGNEQETLVQSSTNLYNKIKLIKERIKELEQRCSNLVTKIQVKKQALDFHKEEIHKSKQNLEGLNSRLQVLIDMKKGYEGFHKAVKKILIDCQYDNEVKCKVCGVIASLIKVPKEIETAVETVLGSSLQYIVTENEEDAKYLINHLKKKNYGRATFLPITSVQERKLTAREREVLMMEGCIGIASDLVSCEPKYKSILHHLLGRVVIAKNMDVAISMARQFSYSFRIVTLSGDLINPGGSMTGGSNIMRDVSILGRDREIESLKKKLALEQDTLKQNQKLFQHEMTEYENCKAELEQAETMLRALEQQLVTEEESLSRIVILKEQSEKTLFSLDEEARQIQQNLKELSLSIERTNNEIEALQDKNVSINQITLETERYLKDKKNSEEECNKDLTNLKIQLASMYQELQNLKEQKKRIESELIRQRDETETIQQKYKSNEKEMEAIKKLIIENNSALESMQNKISYLRISIEQAEEKELLLKESLQEIEKELKEQVHTIDTIKEQKHRLDVQLSKYEVEMESLQNRIWDEYELTWETALPYKDENLTPYFAVKQIKALRKDINDLGDVNVNAIDEYERVNERFRFLNRQRNDLITARENLEKVIHEITVTMNRRFRQEFDKINQCFGITFKKLFGGGKASLVLEDPDDILNCGIDIIAQPPGKKLQSLSLLSGGERALTAIAILFAILKHKPTPFCILDEIDAALDETNVIQFGKIVKEYSKDTQFIIITHRKATMEISDALYGIAMEEKGVSKMISVRLDSMVS